MADTIFGMPLTEAEKKYSGTRSSSWMDYIPNVYGGVPVGLEGLLGAEQAKQIGQRSNIAGLLGTAAALAQGMSGQGPRRSAFQNIIGALASGYGSAGQAYQQGIQNIVSQQQLALQQRQMAGIQAMKMKYPDLADEFDTNPAGAFRIVSEREAAARKPTTVSAGQTLVSPSGQVIFQAPSDRKKNTAVVGNVLVDLDTGMPIYEAPKTTGQILSTSESQALGLPAGIVYQRSSTGEIKPVEGAGAKAPQIRDFADGTTREYDAGTNSWRVLARKPAGEEKTMYSKEPTVDANGRLVFLPTRPGLPVLDAQTGKSIDFAPKGKPLPAILQKSEEEDYDLGRSAANLATDANRYVNSILGGTIKFGVKEKARVAAANVTSIGADNPDIIARNDFERWKTEYINESLRQNKGTQTEGDAIRAAKELTSAESKEDAAKAILRLRDLNARRVQDFNARILERRKNAGAGEPEAKLDIPKFDPVVLTPADYAKVPDGATYIDVNGVRRIKGKRQ